MASSSSTTTGRQMDHEKLGPLLVQAAAHNNIKDICKILHTDGSIVDHLDRFMNGGKETTTTALMEASLHGHVDAARVLISRKADVNRVDEEGYTALHVAAQEGHVPVMELLLSKGARIDARNHAGSTPLHKAAYNGQEASAGYLLDHGAEIDACNLECPPLFLAIEGNKLPLVDLLLVRGADPNFRSVSLKGTALHAASVRGNLAIVKRLVAGGANMDQVDIRGLSPLYFAAQEGHEGHLKVIEFLVKEGADVSRSNNKGMNPLMAAVIKGHLSVINLFLTLGADINASEQFGYTSLILATQSKRLDVVDLLLDRGADPNLTTNHRSPAQGQTALHIAAHCGYLDIARRLIEGGADLDHVDVRKVPPLYFAAQEGHLQVVKLLVKRGSNINLVNVFGASPVHIASFHKRNLVVDYLIEKGAEFEDQGNALNKASSCKLCGATDVTLQKCTGCGIAWYCGPECQKKDWREGGENSHKIQCPRVKAKQEEYKEKKREELERKTRDHARANEERERMMVEFRAAQLARDLDRTRNAWLALRASGYASSSGLAGRTGSTRHNEHSTTEE